MTELRAPNQTLRVIVCGGRGYTDRKHVFATLDRFFSVSIGDQANPTWLARPDLHIIAGGATGVDELAIEWAVVNMVSFEEHPVSDEEWRLYGKAAGHRRNGRMIRLGQPNLVVAFPGGPGTANMLKQAEERGIARERVPLPALLGMELHA